MEIESSHQIPEEPTSQETNFDAKKFATAFIEENRKALERLIYVKERVDFFLKKEREGITENEVVAAIKLDQLVKKGLAKQMQPEEWNPEAWSEDNI